MVPKTSESARLTRLMFHITTITSKINGCLLGTRWVHKMTTGSWSTSDVLAQHSGQPKLEHNKKQRKSVFFGRVDPYKFVAWSS